MKIITITIHTCGMSDETFSDMIMIYKPLHSIEMKNTIDETRLKKTTIDDIINSFKSSKLVDPESWIYEQLNIEHVYIFLGNMLVGLQEDKTLAEVFDFIGTDSLNLVFFDVAGASIHCQGYRFTIHPDEKIHKNTPHVHVIRNNNSCRYFLTTLEPMDMPNTEFRRDYKKIIQPYLEKNQSKLSKMWDEYQHGYSFPSEDIDGKQYYPES